ncbi:uncharacterized protein LOC115433890 [Sphaeramia orbicularis]|uniref:uncharacterized protein LOC115433890 n=1 Tax=Sphaeramia orbicularis TaxID=375764 RepID=UPI00117DCDFA|nr:uncharacterized protein LOC115433890 [Sphaeramia orbicularis]
MAVRGTLVWLCSLTVLFSFASQEETEPPKCNSQDAYTSLSNDLRGVLECGDSALSQWSSQEKAAVLLSMKTLTDTLHKHQLDECRGAEPQKCPEPEVPENGGLACATVNDKRYCKPLCNYGYDFGFIRTSRLFEECSLETGYRWQTQYIGGNKLAVCNREQISSVSGARSAYFPENQDCLATKSNGTLQDSIIEVLKTELKSRGVQGEAQSACLVCG